MTIIIVVIIIILLTIIIIDDSVAVVMDETRGPVVSVVSLVGSMTTLAIFRVRRSRGGGGGGGRRTAAGPQIAQQQQMRRAAHTRTQAAPAHTRNTHLPPTAPAESVFDGVLTTACVGVAHFILAKYCACVRLICSIVIATYAY